jgi:drug/metabolite transporter (DMT)-like permease
MTMSLLDVAAALLSALLHAGWNAAVKANRNPAQAMMAQMVLGAILVAPLLFWTGLPAPGAWPWIAGSALLNLVTVNALLRAYEMGGFGIVYPVVRALAVLFVVPLAALVTGHLVGWGAFAGIAIIAVSLGILAWDASRGHGLVLRAIGWAGLAGLGTAAYILCDAQGVRASGSPLAYGFVASITNALAMCWRQRRAGPVWPQLKGQWLYALPVAVASMLSYVLILWVWNHAPIAPAAALRDTSAVFAILIAVVWLREPLTRTRLAAVLLAAAAVPLLRLG